MNNKETCTFRYNYSAKEQAELKKIREKYTTEKKSDELCGLEKIRAIDRRVTDKATKASLFMGIISSLIMGFGMSIVMTDISDFLGIGSPLAVGIIIGAVGIIGVISAYPIYQKVLEKERRKAASEIIRLTDSLM